MKHIYLERHDQDKNLHRFYQLFITPGIFGDWSLVKGDRKEFVRKLAIAAKIMRYVLLYCHIFTFCQQFQGEA